MNWITAWDALSARIQGLLDSGSFFFQALHTSSEDPYSVRKKVLLIHAEQIFNNLNTFMSDYRSILPPEAYQCIERFLGSEPINSIDFRPPQQSQVRGIVQLALTALAAFRSEFSYLIADTQAIAWKTTERAFVHLQRSIEVDSEVKGKWRTAFDEGGERECEKLGSIHLLSHGIWAFKVDAIGGQTDLVMNEPLSTLSMIENVADCLVLTEWKLVREAQDLQAKIDEALRQAELYSSGALGGIELARYRYLIMVTREKTEMPQDNVRNMITYRHINIAVDPSTPSVVARNI